MPEMTEAGNPNKMGRLWDMAAAKLTKTELNLLKQFSAFLKSHKGLQDIAEKLGRMADQEAKGGDHGPLTPSPRCEAGRPTG
mgnify:CR=1 FL=1